MRNIFIFCADAFFVDQVKSGVTTPLGVGGEGTTVGEWAQSASGKQVVKILLFGLTLKMVLPFSPIYYVVKHGNSFFSCLEYCLAHNKGNVQRK